MTERMYSSNKAPRVAGVMSTSIRVKTSSITANILLTHCDISEGVESQIKGFPAKAETVILYIEQIELCEAYENLQEFMGLNSSYHKETYNKVL